MTTRFTLFLSRVRDERGMAMVMAVALTAVLATVSITVVDVVQQEQTGSRQAVKRNASYQAAEAGIDEYIAKLLDDGSYELHNVHPYESTRRSAGGTNVSATCSAGVCSSTTWSLGNTWTYPSGKNNWSGDRLGNGYEYTLEIRPPSLGSGGSVSILSTGRPKGSTDMRTWRSVYAQIRTAGVADFQMIADEDITYGSTATTYGKIYAAIDSGGQKHTVTHSGHAYADIYGEGGVSGGVTMHGTAKKYSQTTNPSIRTKIPSPINFASFLASISAIQTASQSGGLYFNNSAKDAWFLTFNAGTGAQGTVSVKSCTKSGTSNVEDVKPTTCTTTTTYNVPTNGAIYVAQTAIISGTVNGQVTVASGNNIVIGDNIYYNDKRTGCASSGSPAATADDVLGLDATNSMYVAQYTPDTLNWCAATIAQTGKWQSAPNASTGTHTLMNFTGSTATEGGGQMAMFDTRNYNYDPALLYLQPPWFPVVSGVYTVFFAHELPASFGF